MTKTYSSKSNAIRALKTIHPELVGDLDNAALTATYIRLHCGQSEADKSGWMIVIPAGIKVVQRKIYKGVQYRRRSVEPVGITAQVHEMFDEYQAEREDQMAENEKLEPLTRKQYIAKAVRDGVAYYTARTQYQKWLRG